VVADGAEGAEVIEGSLPRVGGVSGERRRVDTRGSLHYDTKRSEKEILMTTTLELVPTAAETVAAPRTWVAPLSAAVAGALAAAATTWWLLASVVISVPVGAPGL
jgi:hypothetical protein